MEAASSRRICIVTGGHLATCPRMVKAADALFAAGYRVRVVSTRHLPWAIEADTALRRDPRRGWRWSPVSFNAHGFYRIVSGLRQRAANAVARRLGPERCPLPIAARAYGRFQSEVFRAATAEPADLFYGGSGSTEVALSIAARRAGAPYAIDLEDFHTGEHDATPAGRLEDALAGRIEGATLPGAAFLTAGSAAIAEAYAERYGVRPIALHNTFPAGPPPDPEPSPGDGLRLCWFSQTIGPFRGLEHAIRAMGAAGIPGQLHLRGESRGGYLDSLRQLASACAPRLTITHQPPLSPDALLASCRDYDVGLALEPGHVRNNALALSNKALTYPLAGLAVALTDTPGQRAFAHDLGEGALLVPPGDVAALAEGLRRWAADRALLRRARAAAWSVAAARWHWDHPSHRGALLDAVAKAIAR